MGKRIAITGGAGFIAYHLTRKLIADGHEVVSFDNFNDYYDPELKRHRARILRTHGVHVKKFSLLDVKELRRFFLEQKRVDAVVHLAAYAGVRHSMDHPKDYIETNILGTQNLIDVLEEAGTPEVLFASTSCVMADQQLPWREEPATNMQKNPYGYSKRTNECQFFMSKIPNTIGLRFFTVYGPWGRPDMALFQFTQKIINGEPIEAYNYGNMKRDFTYVDDIVNGICVLLESMNGEEKTREIYNIGYGEQVNLMDFIEKIQQNVGQKATVRLVAPHPADTMETWSDTSKIRALGWKPTTSTDVGIKRFVEWYRTYYGI